MEWVVSVFLFGGYVKMFDECEVEVVLDEQYCVFNWQMVSKCSLIVVVGLFVNFVLVIFFYWLVFMFGSSELLLVFGMLFEGLFVVMVLIKNGEQIRVVDGEMVVIWNDFCWLFLQKVVDQESIEFEVINE